MKALYYIVSFMFLLMSCSHANRNDTHKMKLEETLSSLSADANKKGRATWMAIDRDYKYPSKTICLEDIADVRYIPLETTDASLIQGIYRLATSDDRIVICDAAQNSIFLFDQKGKFISTFNRKGMGPQEYLSIYNFAVDFQEEEIYICDQLQKGRMAVYSFDGKFIRDFRFSQKIWPSVLYNYDNNFLIAYDIYQKQGNIFPNERPYLLINKTNGEITPLPLQINHRKSNGYTFVEGDKYLSATINIEPMIKTNDGVVISDFALDTIYNYKSHQLNAVGVRKGFGSNDLSAYTAYSDNYGLFVRYKKIVDTKSKYVTSLESNYFLINNKENSSLCEIKLYLSDLTGSENIRWDCYKNDLYKEGVSFCFNVDLLFTLLEKGRLKGKLKTMVELLEEDANPVLMIAEFKNN